MEWYYNILVPKVDIEWNEDRLLKVTYQSRAKYRAIVQKHALYFKREMHYDFQQYEKNETPYDHGYVEYVAYIFLKDNLNLKSLNDKTDSLAIGSCCFRKRFIDGKNYYWSLDWIWLHPYFRHRKILSEHWERFVNIFCGFYVEEPLSLEMEAFLKKVNWDNDYKKYVKTELPIF